MINFPIKQHLSPRGYKGRSNLSGFVFEDRVKNKTCVSCKRDLCITRFPFSIHDYYAKYRASKRENIVFLPPMQIIVQRSRDRARNVRNGARCYCTPRLKFELLAGTSISLIRFHTNNCFAILIDLALPTYPITSYYH